MERRRAIRHTVDWFAAYRLDATSEWRPCRLIDLATTGATIELLAPLDDDSLEREIQIMFEFRGESTEGFDLLGDIRHQTPTTVGRTHLGIEFKNLTPIDVAILELIERGLDASPDRTTELQRDICRSALVVGESTPAYVAAGTWSNRGARTTRATLSGS
jgi:PilZ domain-containing protein